MYSYDNSGSVTGDKITSNQRNRTKLCVRDTATEIEIRRERDNEEERRKIRPNGWNRLTCNLETGKQRSIVTKALPQIVGVTVTRQNVFLMCAAVRK